MASQTRTVSVTDAWAALADIPAKRVSVLNSTGAALELRMAAETSAGQQITIPDAASVVLSVVSNAKEIQIKASAGAAGVQLVIDQ